MGVHARAGHAQLIQGVVRQDPSGGLLQGAAVRLLDAHDAVLDEVLSDDEGRYVIAQLRVGPYNIQAELPGFQTSVREVTLTLAV